MAILITHAPPCADLRWTLTGACRAQW